MENLNVFVPLEKVDLEKRLVYGTFACEEVDGAGEIMDYAGSKGALEKWSGDCFDASGGKSLGNVREMHGKTAAGKVISLNFDDELKKFVGCVKVVDDGSWSKVLEGVLTGFSLGGGYAKRWPDPKNGKIKRYIPEILEVSLVDKPCIRGATFQLVKADGATELKKFVSVEEQADDLGDLEQGWRAKDGSFHKTKILAEKENKKLAKAAPEPDAEHPAETALKKLEKTMSTLEKPDDGAKGPRLKHGEKDGLEKYMCDVGRLAFIVSELKWLAEAMAIDAAIEGDTPPVDLTATMNTLADALVTVVEHEVAEIKMEDVEKCALPEQTTNALLKFDFPVLKKFKIELPKATDETQVLKEEKEKYEKLVGGLTAGMEKLQSRLDHLERQPRAPKGVVRVVEKGQELPEQKPPGQGTPMESTPSGMSPQEARQWRAENKQRK